MFLLELAIMLMWAKIGGFISNKLKQPAVLGQIIAGVLLGPMVFGILKETEVIKVFAEIGVIFLMFIAGLETDINELRESSRSSAIIAGFGVVVPLILGAGTAYLLGRSLIESLFIGVILTATSVSISVQTLREMGKLRTRQGTAILGAAIIDDVLGIILLTLLISFVLPASAESGILVVIGKMLIFFVTAGVVGYLATKLLIRYFKRVNVGDRVVTIAIIACFLAAFYAEELGVAAITGAYFTGIIFSTTPFRSKVSHNMQIIAYSIFTPIFFISIGLKVESGDLGSVLGFALIITLVAIAGKIIGCGMGARITKFDNLQSLQIGIGMIARAEVALIITNLGLKLNIIGHTVFASVVLLVLLSTLVTPSLLKYVFSRENVNSSHSG